MAQTGGKSGPRTYEHKIPHKESKSYVAVMSDSTYINTRADELGATLSLNFTRTENIARSEKYKVEQTGDTIKQLSVNEYDIIESRVLECSVLLRPDVALGLAVALFTQLSQLPEHTKLQFRIPNIETFPVEPPK